MLYGTLFMMCGAYTLAAGGHVRADFVYGRLQPRTQAGLDLALYFLFFIPGILALIYAGFDYAIDSWRIGEHSTVTAEGTKSTTKVLIPTPDPRVPSARGDTRCIVAATGVWPAPSRVEEIDASAATPTASSSTRFAARSPVGQAHEIDEAARPARP